jgi:hypothetical protein
MLSSVWSMFTGLRTGSLRRRTLAVCVLGATLALAVSACGSSSSTTSAASAGAAGAGGGGGGTSGSTYQARLNFAKCMRAHGVNVPDPSANGGPAGGAGAAGGGFRALRNSPNFQAASQACAKYRAKAFGFGNLTPAQRAQAQQQLVKFAECMRSHSIDIPDPSTSSGGGFGIFRQIPSSERQSPAFQAATKACSSVLPRFGRGAGARGGPGAGGVPSA